eukprot:GHVU01110657.1.p2 GENE.GHVU01110657.1~~GHVU01110657.1.p2  ORF type:complete len:168 (-),score=21.24 GHVU01110657.1:3036-3539(-)
MAGIDDEIAAAIKIQNAWRSRCDLLLYWSLRDMIRMKEGAGRAADYIRGFNPCEARLLDDEAIKTVVRFRLGGDSFPPDIYYKIFITGGLVDLNAFAPRNYAQGEQSKKVSNEARYFCHAKMNLTRSVTEWIVFSVSIWGGHVLHKSGQQRLAKGKKRWLPPTHRVS